MKAAANAQNLLLRVKDVTAVIDQLARWNVTRQNELFGRFDLQRIAMSGHSFGAVTTQAVSGQQGAVGRVSYTDPRIRAAIVFSPSVPRRGDDPVKAFERVQTPWMLMTGTNDVSPIGDIDVPARLAVFDALPPGSKYQLVLDGAEHSVFTDRRLPSDHAQRNPQHHAAILALSTAFLDAYLKSDEQAKQWLNDPSQVRRYLNQADRWQTK